MEETYINIKTAWIFRSNLNPLGTPESVKQAIIHSLDHIAQYPQVGCGVLRERIAESEG